MPEKERDPAELFGWGVAANVAAITRHGPGGSETQSGLKHFRAGAKVWLLPDRWDVGHARVRAIGRHRGRGGRYVPIVVALRHLENLRAAGVYEAAVWRAMNRDAWGWESREEAEASVARWNEYSGG